MAEGPSAIEGESQVNQGIASRWPGALASARNRSAKAWASARRVWDLVWEPSGTRGEEAADINGLAGRDGVREKRHSGDYRRLTPRRRDPFEA